MHDTNLETLAPHELELISGGVVEGEGGTDCTGRPTGGLSNLGEPGPTIEIDHSI